METREPAFDRAADVSTNEGLPRLAPIYLGGMREKKV